MNGVLTLATLVQVALSPAVASEVDLVGVWEAYRAKATFEVPALSERQVEQLRKDGRLKMRLSSGDDVPVGAMALSISTLSKEDLWLASLDADQDYPDDFLSHDLPTLGEELQRWYGFMDIPAPFEDRHFAVRTTVNTELNGQSSGRMWERWWVLDPTAEAVVRPLVEAGEVGKLDLETFDDAIYLPANRGAWIFLELGDDRILWGYHTAASLGGAIPDRLVTGYLFRGLDEIIEDTEGRAKNMPSHYTADHKPLAGGAGQPLSRY